MALEKMDAQQYQQMKTLWNSGAQSGLMSREDVAKLDSYFQSDDALRSAGESFTRAQAGDYSLYENVDPMLKSYLGAKKCYALYDAVGGNAQDPKLQEALSGRLMEADLRAGFAIGAKMEGDMGKFFRDCDRLANRMTMEQSLQSPDLTARLRIRNQLEQASPDNVDQRLQQTLDQDVEQRVQIAKTLFMNQLGKFQLVDKQKNVSDTNESIAEVYAHGGRTVFILPAGKDQKQVMDSIQGQQQELSGLKVRNFATHSIKPRTLNEDGTVAKEPVEQRPKYAGAYNPDKHRGMNASIGGLGQIGPNGKVISADGTNGHMYMHLDPGGEKACGMMLVGFENAGPGKSGRLGHAHGASAKKAGASAFLSDKECIGAVMGGRRVDLSGLDGQQLADLLQQFETGYRNAAKQALSGDSRMLDACNELLCGKQMGVGQMKGMLQGLGVEENTFSLVEQARAGYTKAAGYQAVAPEQAVALKLPQEPKQQKLRITEFEGLKRPTPPETMKKPGFWDKVANIFSFNKENTYVGRYNAHMASMPEQMKNYAQQKRDYEQTLAALERGENPGGLKDAYDRAMEQAARAMGVARESGAPRLPADMPQKSHTVAQRVKQLEDALLGKISDNSENSAVASGNEEQLRTSIRKTQSFQKLVESGDQTVEKVLTDNSLLEKQYCAVLQQMVQKQGGENTRSNEGNQKTQGGLQNKENNKDAADSFMI